MFSSDDRTWMLVGGIFMVAGGAIMLLALAIFLGVVDIRVPILPLLLIANGSIPLILGAAIIHCVRANAARDRELMRLGTQLTATVTEIRKKLISPYRGIPRWQVVYSYVDGIGLTRSGRSRGLGPERIENLKPGDEVQIAVDPRRPEVSLFLGPRPPPHSA